MADFTTRRGSPAGRYPSILCDDVTSAPALWGVPETILSSSWYSPKSAVVLFVLNIGAAPPLKKGGTIAPI